MEKTLKDSYINRPIVKSYIVLQTRIVPLTDIVVATFTELKAAEKYVLRHCYEYGDGISPLTKNFIPFVSYEEYEECSGISYYMYSKKPALKIVESVSNPN